MDRQCTRCSRVVNVSDYPLDEPYICVPCKGTVLEISQPHWSCCDCGTDNVNGLVKCWRCGALKSVPQPAEEVDHPAHYGGANDPYEAIKVIEAWGLGFNLGNTVKYISRAEKKGAPLKDLRKAAWYLAREIAKREKKS